MSGSRMTIRRFPSAAAARPTLLASRALEETGLPEHVQAKITEVFGEPLTAEQVTARILADVRSQGDAAVHRYTRAIEGRDIGSIQVSEREIDEAIEKVGQRSMDALRVAADRIREFHERTRRQSWVDFKDQGALGQLIRPLARVGIYAPGGRATYPSSVLMAAVPARVAGVPSVAMTSPAGPDGSVTPILLAAARVAGVTDVYRMGGAQAVAAMAYGTDSVSPVDKIVGPGNVFVALAKRMVFGHVGIDGLAGPTECLIVADDTADPLFLATDLMAQAEHDPLAQPILICSSERVIDATVKQIERRLSAAPRASIIRESLAGRGAAVLVDSVEEGIELSNEYAPEHLTLCVTDPWSRLGLVRNAGGVFLGELSAEAVGDYIAGPSHIMPTGGTARFSSPLNVDDFIKITSVFSFSKDQLRELGHSAIEIAHAEGLYAHAEAIEVRLEIVGGGPA
ncbi:MAG: histidinol dehydrogenase [Chloroflexota bacterium]